MNIRMSSFCSAVGLGLVCSAAAFADGPTAVPKAEEPARLGVAASQLINPAPALSANQQMANVIAQQLRESGQLRRYTIDITFQNGTAELTGSVADQTQHEEVLRIVQGVPGVERVRDCLVQPAGRLITQTQALDPNQPSQPEGPQLGPQPRRDAEPQSSAGTVAEPTPIFQAGPPGSVAAANVYNPPPMPPYAWPTYAPYNNYSRVAYPTTYPYNAWPFIGPMHPFPKIPPGWRSVKLTWQDGHWWYGRTATGHDWWRVRYW